MGRPAPPALAKLAALALFAFLAAREVGLPGLQYDEALFVNAALGGADSDGAFVWLRVLGVPVLLMPYLGALKAWLCAPVFALAGVSLATIRLPSIAVSLGSLLVASRLLRRFSGDAWVASLALLALAADPSFVVQSRLDWGPVAIGVLAKLAALALYVDVVERRSPRALALLAAVVAAGLFDKLSFLWFAVALAVAAAAFHAPALRALGAEHGRRVLAPALALLLLAAGSLALAAFLFLRAPLNVAGAPQALSERIPFALSLCASTLDGRAVFELTTGSPHPCPSVVSYFLIVVPLGLGLAVRRRDTRSVLDLLFLTTLGGVVLAELALTRQAGGPHHVMALWPFPQLAAAAALGAVARAGPRARALALALLVALSVSQARATLAHLAAWREGRFSVAWSPEISSLARALDHEAADAVLSADWGTHTQLVALSPRERRARLGEIWQELERAADDVPARAEIARRRFLGRSVLVVLRANGAATVPRARASFEALAREAGLRLERVALGEASALYEVVRCSSP